MGSIRFELAHLQSLWSSLVAPVASVVALVLEVQEPVLVQAAEIQAAPTSETPTMSRAQAIAWKVLNLLPTGTAFAIKAQPEPIGEGEPPTAGRTWTQSELRDIEDGIVPACRRYDAEFVAEEKAEASP